MKLKVVVNGNPFYYGRAILSYNPLADFDEMTANRTFFSQDLIAASQRPHIYINPTTSTGGEMELPFFNPYNTMDIPYEDWMFMGDCWLTSMTDLRHANGRNAPITVSIFAWAENVSFAIPTQTLPGGIIPQGYSELTNQSRDEYGQGKLSGPATTAAKVASWFKDVPMIGPYARATEMGATVFAKTAATFGYSKPLELDKGYYEPTTKASLATVNERETATKLSVDSKQELTIDPRISGVDTGDEMSILSIATRESYLTSFNWNLTHAEEARLFTCLVDPGIHARNDTELHFPACAFAVMPFEHWKGSMRFRFQVVCSGYHRGRLKVVYDPSGTPGTLAEYNTTYTTIVDITDESDFSIDIGWGQPYAWMNHADLDTAVSAMYTTSGSVGSHTMGNGAISVYVVNALSAPHETYQANISVNVFVSMLDDFEVANPTGKMVSRLRLFDDLSPAVLRNQGATEELPHPTADEAVADPPQIDMDGAKTLVEPEMNLIHYGEVIGSFRQMLKRFSYHETMRFAGTGALSLYTNLREQFPHYTGYVGNSVTANGLIVDVNSGTDKYIYGGFPLIHYVSCAYAGRRGGIRYFLEIMNGGSASKLGSNVITISRQAKSELDNTVVPLGVTNLGQLGTLGAAFGFNDADGHAGLTKWAPSVNRTTTVEIPYYSRYRFTPAKLLNKYTARDKDATGWVLMMTDDASSGSTTFINSYVAAAEDYTCFFYLGPPRFYDNKLNFPVE
ncbi:hypothetical protein 2 [Beihai picorna-like virus 30]|uniref:hypothetical protein 2 n=1 Tax=Beihai picorna-like virus 30 TaxID=1922573 RepID=UPI000909C721|nr:hypothetical protein 2 [Beihai picorna-like virus 30]APG76854.1 hypothetical protein 2 [Beihai picorna-like virus 30]